MIKMNPLSRLAISVGIIVMVLVIIIDTNDDVRPNQEYFHEVEEWAGYEACCDMTWYEMCEDYQEVKNISFDCFE